MFNGQVLTTLPLSLSWVKWILLKTTGNPTMDTHLNAGNVEAAMVVFRQIQKLDERLDWKESFLLKLDSQLQKNEDWEKVETYSGEYLQRFHTWAIEIRSNLARLYLLHKSSPRKAIKTIQQFEQADLNETQRKVAQQIIRRCQQDIEDGVMEIGDE
jgi:hypothetical protein